MRIYGNFLPSTCLRSIAPAWSCPLKRVVYSTHWSLWGEQFGCWFSKPPEILQSVMYLFWCTWRGSWRLRRLDTELASRRCHVDSVCTVVGCYIWPERSAASRWDTGKHWLTNVPGDLAGLKAPGRQSWAAVYRDTSTSPSFSVPLVSLY